MTNFLIVPASIICVFKSGSPSIIGKLIIRNMTDPNYLFLLLFLLGTVYLGFITHYSNNGMRISLASPYSGGQDVSEGI
jgi:hypothetical protein